MLSVNAVYELPIGQGKRFSTGNHVVDYLVGNWQTNGILLIRSGQPYTMVYSQDQANTGNCGRIRKGEFGWGSEFWNVS